MTDRLVRLPLEDRVQLAAELCPGAPLDPGIVEAVKALQDAGLQTAESCEGGEGHAYHRPTVVLIGGSADGWQALAVCKNLRFPIRSLDRVWAIQNGEPSGPWWRLTFSRDSHTNRNEEDRHPSHPSCSQVLSAYRSDSLSSRAIPEDRSGRLSDTALTELPLRTSSQSQPIPTERYENLAPGVAQTVSGQLSQVYRLGPGGVFLPDDTLMFALNETGDQIAVIAWPEWANRRLTLELDGMSVRIREKPSIVVRNNRFDVEST